MSQQHSPEPWTVSGCEIVVNDPRTPCQPICYSFAEWDSYDPQCTKHTEIDAANRRRIVACVNACAGIPTEQLERMAPRWLHGLLADQNWIAD